MTPKSDIEIARAATLKPIAEIAARLAEWSPPPRSYERGYNTLFARHIGQAHDGCDFDFLVGAGGVPEPEIH